ncbi:MAG TPA: hypothetical protein VLO31_06505 [Cryobacterium sp.]|nr:hypothetical protein [Cryobacterium sp.]
MTISQDSHIQPTAQPPVEAKLGNGLGVAALVIGIIALIGSFIPLVNFGSGFLAAIGLILGIIGLFRKTRRKGVAIAGTIISGLALILSIVLAITYTAALATAVQTSVDETEAAANVDVSLVYEVTGDSTDASVSYSTYTDGSYGSEMSTGQALPFTKEMIVKAGGDFDFSSFTLTANNGATGADITCRITRDGEVISEQTSTGAYAMALCSSGE